MMLESYKGRPPYADVVWVVSVSRDEAIARMQMRNGLALQQIEQRLAAQWSNEQREQYADIVIRTERPVAETRAAVLDAWRQLIGTE
jgi:dephospho-CoA kinase